MYDIGLTITIISKNSGNLKIKTHLYRIKLRTAHLSLWRSGKSRTAGVAVFRHDATIAPEIGSSGSGWMRDGSRTLLNPDRI